MTAITPIGLNRKQAAAYIGISPTLFDQLVADGRMPCPIEINKRRIWDRAEVEKSFRALKNAGDDALGSDQDDNPESDWEDAVA